YDAFAVFAAALRFDSSRSCQFRFPCACGHLGLYFVRGLVLAQAFEAALAHHASGAETGEFDFRHQLWLDPMNARFMARRALTRERAGLAFLLFQAWQKLRHSFSAISGADASHIDQVFTFMDAHQ